MHYIVVDLEATCWEKNTVLPRMEIIEIGAVKLDDQLFEKDIFCSFVRPIREPMLSDFCKRLTSISQSDVDQADDFKSVFPRFLSWIGDQHFKLCSWGSYDFKQLKADCERHGLTFPFAPSNHVNLKQVFSKTRMIRPCGMAHALQILNLPLEGTHHRGIDDARNISRIVQILGIDALRHD